MNEKLKLNQNDWLDISKQQGSGDELKMTFQNVGFCFISRPLDTVDCWNHFFDDDSNERKGAVLICL